MKYILIIGLALLVLLEYALMVIAHEADERAERMYEEWRRKNERSNNQADKCLQEYEKGAER